MNEEFTIVKSIHWSENMKPEDINKTVKIAILVFILVGFLIFGVKDFIAYLTQNPFYILFIPICLIMYIILHELIHGVFMTLFSGKKTQYGYNSFSIYAKSDACFQKSRYFILTLAPFVLINIVILISLIIVPSSIGWFFIFIAIINLFFSRGDLHSISLLKDLPFHYYIKDTGETLHIYKKVEKVISL